MESNILKIQQLNDVFRKTFTGGKVLLTRGISSLPQNEVLDIVHLVQTFNNFNLANDPYGEHNFGSFDYNGNTIFWKIDYYDNNYCFFSNDPSSEGETKRVMTVMFASEY